MNKIIHYIWLGKKEKPAIVKKCINSWKKHLPDWEIIEWNEDNLDIDMCPFTSFYYKEKKYAFVADVFRLEKLVQYGGIYFDTDVELIKNIDDLLTETPFMAFENKDSINPGLVLYFPQANNSFLTEILQYYTNIFHLDGTKTPLTINQITTSKLLDNGLIQNDSFQTINGISIYPSDYFCPTNVTWNVQNITKNTRSIHHYSASWKSKKKQLEYKSKALLRKTLRLDNQIKLLLIHHGLLWK